MFFYLFYNSSIINTNSKQQKNISTLIYGSIIYIILHAILFFKNNNEFIKNFQRYFWILFSLDCISVLFTHISNNETIFVNKINFEKPKKEDIKHIKEEIKELKKSNKKPNTKPNLKSNLKKDVNINIKKDNRRVRFNSETDANSDIGSSASGSDYDLDEFEKMLSESTNN